MFNVKVKEHELTFHCSVVMLYQSHVCLFDTGHLMLNQDIFIFLIMKLIYALL